MADWSFEHVTETRAALRTIVCDPAYGAAALSNVRIMSDVLPRLLRGAQLERSVLVTAAGESLASTMLKHVSEGMDPGTAVRLAASFLNAISPVPLEACYWVAAELALALGLITVEQADELGSCAAGPPGSPGSPASPDDSAAHSADSAARDGSHPRTIGSPRPPRPPPAGSAGPHDDTAAAPVAPPVPPPRPAAPGGERFGVQPAQPYGQPVAPYGQPAAGQDDWITRAVRESVHPGLLAFNPPPEMQQGRAERIEVGIARSPELRDALTAGFRGRGLPEVLKVDAAPVMGVELRGSSFQVDALSPGEQLVVPLARWEFDVTPLKSGSQTLTLCVSIRIDSPFASGGKIAVPVLERDINIKIDVVYGTRRFVAANWQWLVGTAIGLGGGIAAWVALVH
ncbi:MAG TPA: hypothetical protein VFW16_02280 [Streptosporangiaceae bacterium]|nr:hypothetical protein [Streptosporangiaceae bacterium]